MVQGPFQTLILNPWECDKAVSAQSLDALVMMQGPCRVNSDMENMHHQALLKPVNKQSTRIGNPLRKENLRERERERERERAQQQKHERGTTHSPRTATAWAPPQAIWSTSFPLSAHTRCGVNASQSEPEASCPWVPAPQLHTSDPLILQRTLLLLFFARLLAVQASSSSPLSTPLLLLMLSNFQNNKLRKRILLKCTTPSPNSSPPPHPPLPKSFSQQQLQNPRDKP